MISNLLAFIPPPPSRGFHIGPLFFHFYGLAIAVGVLCAFWLARKRWQDLGRDPSEIEIAGIWEGGLALYGGLTLGILTGIYVAWRRRLPVLLALDAAIPGIPLAQAFGRWGNYFNQELFGTPTRVPWALEVDPAYRPARYRAFETFHPTLLYESLWDLVIVGTLLWLSARRKLHTGSIVLCYLGMYAFGRFGLELIRTDTTFRLLGLSRNAWVSLGVVVGAGVWLYLRERRRPAAPAPVTAGAAEGPEAAESADGPDGSDAPRDEAEPEPEAADQEQEPP